MKREISSVVEASTLAIAPVASGTSASVLKAAAPCQRAKRRPEDGVLVDSVMGVLRACGKRSLYAAPRARPTALRVLIDHFASRSPGHCSRDTEQPAWRHDDRSEEHTSELQSLMRISYAVFCLKKKNKKNDKKQTK